MFAEIAIKGDEVTPTYYKTADFGSSQPKYLDCCRADTTKSQHYRKLIYVLHAESSGGENVAVSAPAPISSLSSLYTPDHTLLFAQAEIRIAFEV